jgi:hypothetical protein
MAGACAPVIRRRCLETKQGSRVVDTGWLVWWGSHAGQDQTVKRPEPCLAAHRSLARPSVRNARSSQSVVSGTNINTPFVWFVRPPTVTRPPPPPPPPPPQHHPEHERCCEDGSLAITFHCSGQRREERVTASCCPAITLHRNRWKRAVLAAFRARDVAVGAPTAPIWLIMEDCSRG